MLTEMVYQNVEATIPLRISLDVICNTPEEKILENIRINSAGRKGWQKLEEAHDRVAVICGSGPSLADCIKDIQKHYDAGHEIYALNGAARFLMAHRMMADYQVILDAKPETATLVGPAVNYLFAAQVDPELFRKEPNAKLWQVTHGEIAPEFPDYDEDYCFVGGSISVGNAAMVLAYVRGHRTMHLYGYDSSHRGERGHAFRQQMNDGDPCTIVRFRGKEYVCSLTMRLQTQYFFPKVQALRQEGCHIEVHGSGLLPDMFNAQDLSEKDKYEMMWLHREYGHLSPGESLADLAVEKLGLKEGMILLELGCGCGKGGMRIRLLTGCDIVQVDIAENARDGNVYFPFYVRDLREPIGLKGDAAYCCDVMEHIPPEDVDRTIQNIMTTAPVVFFGICLVEDNWGELIGQPLHLSVHPDSWWKATFERLGYKVRWTHGQDSYACFVISTT